MVPSTYRPPIQSRRDLKVVFREHHHVELALEKQVATDAPDPIACWKQKAPAR
jgi:hypothetical protein